MFAPTPLSYRLGQIASEAGSLAQEVRNHLVAELKSDGTIVTNADRAVEETLRPQLAALLPGTTVWGEEFGYSAPGEAGIWLVDPIDGTSNFRFGGPQWGVSIALISENHIQACAIALPDLGEVYTAESGHGAYLNGNSIAPIPSGPIRDEELLSCGDAILRRFQYNDLPGKPRLSGAFVIDGTFVATQRYRAMIAMRERLYDVAAAVLICQEVGADVRYADGSPFEISPLLQNVKIDKPWLLFPRDSGFNMPPLAF